MVRAAIDWRVDSAGVISPENHFLTQPGHSDDGRTNFVTHVLPIVLRPGAHGGQAERRADIQK